MSGGLASKRVLVVEDEYFLADDLAHGLARAGAHVVGPVSTQAEAFRLIGEAAIDLAVIDINLRGRSGFEVADALAARRIPFVFATGYDADVVPERHAGVRRWEKPFNIADLLGALSAGGA